MKIIVIIIVLGIITGCEKKLELKPNSNVTLLSTEKDLEMVLDNTDRMNNTLGLAHISADEYFIPNTQLWQSLRSNTMRNAPIWQADIYAAETNIPDWTNPYASIYYCNNVLDILSKQDIGNSPGKAVLKGWALFGRAYALHSLATTFCKAYEESTASTDLGLPLKLSANIDEILPRSSLQETYNQIISDVTASADLLQRDIIPGKRTRPSKVAAYALLSRVYLSMRSYGKAEIWADKALELYSVLTDFNTLSKLNNSFTYDSEEIIYFTKQINTYSQLASANANLTYGVDTNLIALYSPNDLRISIYFQKNSMNHYNVKRINSLSTAPFTGLATDEIILIKAECLARRNEYILSMQYLNQLLSKRWGPNETTPAQPFQNIIATSPAVALNHILTERRKALVWRSLRWSDLKRYNLESRNITIQRKLDDVIYTLEPNSNRYILPIPYDEIALSGIQQNQR